MQLSRFFSLGLTVAGTVAAGRVLLRRHRWEQAHRHVAICVDYDDAQDAAIRAALPFDEMLHCLAEHGATHVSLPELTIDRLLAQGELAAQAPVQPLDAPPRVGHWNYLHGPPALVAYLAHELRARLPYTEARVLEDNTLAFAGNRPAIGEIGLGYDQSAARRIQAQGLGVVPRPVSYAWPEKALLERTLSQSAQYGTLVAFAGDMILGHEMHLEETVAAMAQNDLTLVYFAQSRHQKGDWFVAKRRAPHVVLGHRFSPADMIPLDYHAAAHNWAHLVLERGIRFCYVNFFRVLHATEPLEGLQYVAHLRSALEEQGFVVDGQVRLPGAGDEVADSRSVPEPSTAEMALTGLAPAGIATAAARSVLDLPDVLALPLTAAAAGGAAALPFLEQAYSRACSAPEHHGHQHDHGHERHGHNGHSAQHQHDQQHHGDHKHGDHDHEHHDHGQVDLQALYPPSYAPKLLALAAASLGPVAALDSGSRKGPSSSPENWIYVAGAAAALAAVTSGLEYVLRIEEYRGFGLDWLLPLAGATIDLPDKRLRLAALVTLAGSWLAARQAGEDDFLARFDAAHAVGHTHHISTAMRLVGDLGILLGPRPARKWAGLGPLALAARRVLKRRGEENAAAAAAYAGALGGALTLTAFRRPERALSVTARQALPSFAAGAGLGLLLQKVVS